MNRAQIIGFFMLFTRMACLPGLLGTLLEGAGFMGLNLLVAIWMLGWRLIGVAGLAPALLSAPSIKYMFLARPAAICRIRAPF
jgi:hypothetical protein